MKNIESAKIAIESEINFLESRLKICLQIKEGLIALIEGVEMPVNSENSGASIFFPNINPKDFPDYPFNKRLVDRLKYLDEKFPKAWKMRDRLELMVRIEGPESRERFRNMSTDLNNLVNGEHTLAQGIITIKKLNSIADLNGLVMTKNQLSLNMLQLMKISEPCLHIKERMN